MTDIDTDKTEEKNTLRSTRQMCRAVSALVIDMLTDQLLRAAGETKDQLLSSQQIAEISRNFKAGRGKDYMLPIHKIAEDWLNEIEQDIHEQSRKRPFERLIVRRFSHLFPPSESLESGCAVSRRAIPGLFNAFEAIAKAEFVEQCRGACRGILKRLKAEEGSDFTWNMFYNDIEANDLVDDLLIVVAWSFKDYEKRFKWLLKRINSNLAAPEAYFFEGAEVEYWQLSAAGLEAMLTGLFAEYRTKLDDPDVRQRLSRRYGEQATAALLGVLAELKPESVN